MVVGVDEYSRGGSTTGDFEPVGRRRNATTPRRGSCSGGNAAGIIPLINHTQHPAVYASPNGWGFFVGSSGWVSTAVAVRQQATLKPVGRRRKCNDAPLIASNYALINSRQKRVIVRSGDPIMAILRNDV